MSAEGLQRALGALGVECTVEARDKLAVIVPEHANNPLRDADVRRAALALLREHGFTHLALEIPDTPPGNAALSGD